MKENEALARALAQRLQTEGIDARVDGGGVHWHVDVTAAQDRALRVDCFWYGSMAGLVLGMNPGNARYRLKPTRSDPDEDAHEHGEYLVQLNHAEERVAEGRTGDFEAVVAGVHSWCAHGDLERLMDDAPFIGESDRAVRAIARQLDPALLWEIQGDPTHQLWVYGGDRRCAVYASPAAVGFRIGQAQVALGEGLDDLPAAVSAWLIERVSLPTLAARFPTVAVERHAEALEIDPLDWHWRHVRDRIADPDDVLAPMRPLIERLAQSPVATRFYSFSSWNRFCFSASSHYPWIDGGLPVVGPAPDGRFWVDGEVLDLDAAVQRIETLLRDYPIRPRFGTSDDEEAERLAERLALTPCREPCGAYDVWVITDPTGARRCYPRWASHVDAHCVRFVDERGERSDHWPTVDEAAAAIRRFCETDAW